MASRKNNQKAVPLAGVAGGLGERTYKPTAEEQAAVERDQKRWSERRPAPRVKIDPTNEGVKLGFEHQDERVAFTLLSDALGTSDPDFVNGVLLQILEAIRRDGKVSEADFNFVLSVIKDANPRNQFEAMLAAQMAVVHVATMTLARRLGNVKNLAEQDSAANALTKLSRTFTGQLDALKRYRHGGEQKVIVQHVNVNDGGQAIVANVTQAEQAKRPGATAPGAAPALTHSEQAPMPILDERQAAPVHRENAKETKANGRRPPP
ncbi:hypothetical protein [Methylocystis echinoides]|uniref:Uncharacterized protein n=1 Tax=Methylocystis echinoides TaxID=29468 RepID=A0A9W6GPX7_9HYPH|nr:hypothetical protein [Methylocystis echinoides]GLI91093.1 hypothetical protein LMG27198_00850 [Methylocystis echinoides]